MSSVKAEELISPEGEIQEAWFPNTDLLTLLRRRVEKAESGSRFSNLSGETRRDAIAAYAYEAAYRHIYRRKAHEPSSVDLAEQGGEQQTDRQVERWREMADEKEDKWRSLVNDDTDLDETPTTRTINSPSAYV
jgi:hypothetical protein